MDSRRRHGARCVYRMPPIAARCRNLRSGKFGELLPNPSPAEPELLGHSGCRDWLLRRMILGLHGVYRLVGEVVAVPETAVEKACQLRCAGPKNGPAPLEEEDRHQAALGRIRERGKPAKTGSLVGAGAGLAEDRKLVEVHPGSGRCRTRLRPPCRPADRARNGRYPAFVSPAA